MNKIEAIKFLDNFSSFKSVDFIDGLERIVAITLKIKKEHIKLLQKIRFACNKLNYLEQVTLDFEKNIKMNELYLNFDYVQELHIKNLKLNSIDVYSETIYSMHLDNVIINKLDLNKLRLPELNSLHIKNTIVSDEIVLTNNESLYLETLVFKDSDIDFDFSLIEWKNLKEISFEWTNIRSLKISDAKNMQYIGIENNKNIKNVIIENSISNMLNLDNCPNIDEIKFDNSRIFEFYMNEGHECKSLELFNFLRIKNKKPKLIQKSDISKQLF